MSLFQIESTFIMIKPDGVQRNFIGEIIQRFEKKGYQLTALKFTTIDLEHAKKHYIEHQEKEYFDALCKHMTRGPVVVMVWSGKDVIKGARNLIGVTNPSASAPGTIRGDFGIELRNNIIHGSDSLENAKREIDLWFQKTELIDWTQSNKKIDL